MGGSRRRHQNSVINVMLTNKQIRAHGFVNGEHRFTHGFISMSQDCVS